MVDELLENMQMLRDDFQARHDAAAKFVQWANDQLDEMDVNLVMEESLPIKRQRQHKRIDGELSIDEAASPSDPVNKYRIEVYNRIVDTIVSRKHGSMEDVSGTEWRADEEGSVVEAEGKGHVGKGTKDRLEAKRRVLYQYVDEAVDILKSQVQTMEKRKIFLLEKQIEKVQQKMAYFTEPESSLQTALQELGVFSFLGVIRDVMKRIEFVSGFQSMKVTPSKVLDWSQEVNDLDSLMNDNKTFVERRTERPTEHPEMDEFEWNSYRSLYVRCPSLDPNSANEWIKISEQLKRATRASPKFQYSQSTYDNRNDYCVLSSESFSSGRHYWRSMWVRFDIAESVSV
uniref:uncharacterized protein n=1 Tax=Myxine glutinosa TaxID=7769 RepID=UPI00358FC640